ncbi:MAG TPA: hypothetical protein VHB46_19785, partial [Burkholderiales bacterium]|nr:hypothetical protein [Burkholderiales bacterium]
MIRQRICKSLAIAALVGLALQSVRAWAQELVPNRGVKEVESPPPETGVDLKVDAKAGGEWVLMPIPVSNPSIGTGLALTALHLFPFGGASQPSLIGAGAAITSNGTWVAGGGTKLRLDEDRWRLTAGGGVGSLHYDFFGIGEDAGNKDQSIPLVTRTVAAVGSLLRRVGEGLYAGGGLRYAGT